MDKAPRADRRRRVQDSLSLGVRRVGVGILVGCLLFAAVGSFGVLSVSAPRGPSSGPLHPVPAGGGIAVSTSPSQGPVGSQFAVNGTGFTPGVNVSVSFGSTNETLTAGSDCATVVGNVTTDAGGNFSCDLTTPNVPPGPYNVTGTNVTASESGTAVFTVTVPAITVVPVQGPIGAVVRVSGSGFSVSSPVAALSFDGVSISTCTGGSLSTNATGVFGCAFAVPSGTSGTTVTATDLGGQSGLASFLVTLPAITVVPGQGPQGAQVGVSGTGFSVSSALASLTFGGVPISACDVSGSLNTNSTGAFSCVVRVPAGTTGSTVTATDIGGQSATAAFTLTTPSLSVGPSQGPVGSTVRAIGTGFTVSTTLASLVFDNVVVLASECSAGNLTADRFGSFSCTFGVPLGTSTNNVVATDSGGQTGTTTFNVTTPGITVTPRQGPIGSMTTVSGTGFSVSLPIASLDFNGVPVSSCVTGTLTTGASGTFACSVPIAGGMSGTVTARDAGGQSATGSFTITTLSLTVSPGQGPVGSAVTVAGSGFSVEIPLSSLYFDGVPISACSPGSLVTNSAGAFSCGFPVPVGTSGTAVTATDSGGQSATGTFDVTALGITVNPNMGSVGSSYAATGSGFSVGSGVRVSFGGAAQTPTGCSQGSYAGTTVSTNPSGGFTCTFPVPDVAAGAYSVLAQDLASGDASNSVQFTVTPLSIQVTPGQGPVGSTVTVSGTGFQISSPLASLIFDGVAITTCLSGGSLTTDATGAFTCPFHVPAATSGTVVNATNAGGDYALGAFAVTSVALGATPLQGPVGATFVATGSGFTVDSTATVAFFGVDLAAVSCSQGSSNEETISTTDTGGFSCTFEVPAESSGVYSIVGSDVSTSTSTNSIDFVVTPLSVAVAPAEGPEGASVTVSGTGYSVSLALGTLVFDGVSVASCTAGSLTTDAAGSFSCQLAVPAGTSGSAVIATDLGGEAASTSFVVTTPALSLSPGQGPPGAEVTVRGTGFSLSSPLLSLVFGGVSVSGCTSGSLLTNATGEFSCSLTVPTGSSGSSVLAKDVGGEVATGLFAVTTPAISVTPGQGPQGTNVTVVGSGFSVSTAVGSLVFDGVTITICTSGSLISDGSGAFSCTFAVPAGTSSTAVLVTDAGGLAAGGIFSVTVPAVAISPGRVPVGGAFNLSASGFLAEASATVGLEGTLLTPSACTVGTVVRATIVTSAVGAFDCTFTLPVGPGGAVVITTSQGSLQVATSFTIIPSLSLTSASGKVGTSVSAAGTGFAGRSPYTVDWNSSLALCSGTTSSAGEFSCSYLVPSAPAGEHPITALQGTATVTAEFTIVPNVVFSPDSGTVGTLVTVTGTGFDAVSAYRVTWNGTTTLCSGTTSSNGAFDCSFVVPSALPGAITVTASEGSNSPTFSFTVTSSPPPAPPGSAAFPWWELAVAGSVLVALLVAALLFARRRPRSGRRSGARRSTATGTVQSWEGGPSAGPISETSVPGTEPSAPVGPAATAAAETVAPEAEPNIDELIARLDRMSLEMFKKTPKQLGEETEEDSSATSDAK